MASRNDKQLEDLIVKRMKYAADSVEAAIAELEKRGRIFSFAELRAIDLDLRAKKRAENEKPAEPWFQAPAPDTTLRVQEAGTSTGTDETLAPSYFSPRAINIFTILFGAIYGAILLAINFNKSGNKKAVWEVVIFGILYSIGISLLMRLIPVPAPKQQVLLFLYSALQVLFNVLGAFLLTRVFWKKYIGTDTQFTARPIGNLIFISVLVVIGIVYLLMRTGNIPVHVG